MARVKGPLFSGSASGNIGRGSVQFRRDLRGVHVYCPPAPASQNQKAPSLAQAAVRQRYRDARIGWAGLDLEAKSSYRARAVSIGMTGWNLFVKEFTGAPPPDNQLPVAVIDSSPSSPVQEGALLLFSGHGVDADGVVVGHEWRSSLDGSLSALAQFSTAVLSAGSHIIQYRVRDDAGAWSAYSTVDLLVEAVPPAPYTPPSGDAVEFAISVDSPLYVPPLGSSVVFVL